MKKCSKCREVKPLNEYNKSKSGKFGVHHYCMICLRENKKIHYNHDKAKLRFIQNKYKLNELELNEMFIAQNKKCKICQTKYDLLSRHNGLYIDHCHKTGKVRGLLCMSCNRLLGNCNDNIDILKSSILYITEFGA
jgi:hypothetical protein